MSQKNLGIPRSVLFRKRLTWLDRLNFYRSQIPRRSSRTRNWIRGSKNRPLKWIAQPYHSPKWLTSFRLLILQPIHHPPPNLELHWFLRFASRDLFDGSFRRLISAASALLAKKTLRLRSSRLLEWLSLRLRRSVYPEFCPFQETNKLADSLGKCEF